MQLYNKLFSTLAYPLLVWLYVCGLLSLRWSSIHLCGQMWELLVVNMEMMIPLL